MSLKPFALIAPDACVVTCGYRLHSEIISRSHLLIRQVLTSQSEGSTILYRPRENRQQVGGDDPRLDITEGERVALRNAHDALQFGAEIAGTNASPGQTRILDLVWPKDPPILQAFAEELERWPEVDQFLEEAFRER